MHIVLTILGVSMLIVLHEAGHYWVARAFDMRVLRFSLGFGPPLVSHQRGETLYQIAALPFGGFVQVDGMGLREDDVVDDERNYRNKPAWQRAAVVFAGPLVNWLLAAALVTGLGMTAGVGVPDESATIGIVGADTPAEEAGLRVDDRIVAVDGNAVESWIELVAEIQARPEKEMTLTVKRDDETLNLTATPRKGATGGILGIGPAS
ncbi:MAG: M50 family metallopeptidase, partial [Myxococcota bacterium]